MKVAKKYSCFGTGNNQNDKHQKQETKHVIHLVGPNAIQNEEKLYKDAAKRQNAPHDDARQRLCVERLLRNLTRDLIGSNWVFNGILLKAKVCTNKRQRHRYAEPEGQDGNQSAKRNGC